MSAALYNSAPQMSARLCAKQAHAAPQPHAKPEQRESAAERSDFRREIALVMYGPQFIEGVEI